MWFFIFIKRLYFFLIRCYYAIRYPFVSVHQLVVNPFMFKKDVNLTARWFYYQVSDVCFILNKITVLLLARSQRALVYICYSCDFFLFEWLSGNDLYALVFIYYHWVLEWVLRRHDMHNRVYHYLRIVRTLCTSLIIIKDKWFN